jgi:phosphatidylcholine synthase
MRALAFCVHILTASGAALALLALLAASLDQWAMMFWLLGLALIVDGIDGPLARRLRVAELLPRWSGETLDLVVDFTTYVVVPAYAIAAAGLMSAPLAITAGALVTISGALYFADREMKTADNHFKGFPAVWNLIVFYLLLLRPGEAISMIMVIVFTLLTFVPVTFVHPLRVARLRVLTVALLAIWAVLALVALVQDLAPGFSVTAALCLIALYFLTIGLLPRPRSPT